MVDGWRRILFNSLLSIDPQMIDIFNLSQIPFVDGGNQMIVVARWLYKNIKAKNPRII